MGNPPPDSSVATNTPWSLRLFGLAMNLLQVLAAVFFATVVAFVGFILLSDSGSLRIVATADDPLLTETIRRDDGVFVAIVEQLASQLTIADPSELDAPESGTRFNLVGSEVEVTVDRSSDTVLLLPLIVSAVLLAAAFFALTTNLNRFAKNLKNSQVFDEVNSKLLRIAGRVIIALAVGSFVYSQLVSALLTNSSHNPFPDGLDLHVESPFSIVILVVVGLFLLVLAEVFKLGSQLQKVEKVNI